MLPQANWKLSYLRNLQFHDHYHSNFLVSEALDAILYSCLSVAMFDVMRVRKLRSLYKGIETLIQEIVFVWCLSLFMCVNLKFYLTLFVFASVV